MILFPILIFMGVLAFTCVKEHNATGSKISGFIGYTLVAVVCFASVDIALPLARETYQLSRVTDALVRLDELEPKWRDSLRRQLGLAPNGELCNPGLAIMDRYDDDISRLPEESKTEAYAQAKTYCESVRALTSALDDITRSTLYPVVRYVLLPVERDWIEVKSKALGFRSYH